MLASVLDRLSWCANSGLWDDRSTVTGQFLFNGGLAVSAGFKNAMDRERETRRRTGRRKMSGYGVKELEAGSGSVPYHLNPTFRCVCRCGRVMDLTHCFVTEVENKWWSLSPSKRSGCSEDGSQSGNNGARAAGPDVIAAVRSSPTTHRVPVV